MTTKTKEQVNIICKLLGSHKYLSSDTHGFRNKVNDGAKCMRRNCKHLANQ